MQILFSVVLFKNLKILRIYDIERIPAEDDRKILGCPGKYPYVISAMTSANLDIEVFNVR